MTANEKDGLDALLFGTEGTELVDFKCFRGDREDISEDDIKEQIHSALMQKKMGRAMVSTTAPRPDVAPVSVSQFVRGLSTPA
jgi:hypothetical protein